MSALTTLTSGGDLRIAHVPSPVDVGDVLELGHGPILLLCVVDPVETPPHSPLAAPRLMPTVTATRASGSGRIHAAVP